FYPPEGVGLAQDDLLLRRLEYIDRLGALFTLRLDLYSRRDLAKDGRTTLDDLIGAAARVRVNLEDAAGGEDGIRWFHGIIAEFARVRSDTSNLFQYEAIVVPAAWLLTQNRDCRIFQDPPNSVLDIVTSILDEHGITVINSVDAAQHRGRTYCVQYRESDFDFISRLMEDEGLYYHFEHQASGCSMVLCDGAEDHDAFPGYAVVLDGGRPTDDIPNKSVSALSIRHRFHASRSIVTDYDHLAQSNRNPSAISASATPTYDVVEYPGAFHRPVGQTAQVTAYADLRRKSAETRTRIVAGESPSTGLVTGCLVSFDAGHAATDYLITDTRLVIRSNDFESSDPGPGGDYGTVAETQFEAIDASVRFVPERTTPRPIVHGVQTAIVVGDPGEHGDPPETDEFGRVRVRFHWDGYGREAAGAAYRSCWVRVSQLWAGKTWGAMTLPHKGQEVIVDFEEGDPDRPIITGRVYNRATMPYLDPQENVNRFVLRDLGENRMTMDSTDGRQSIEFFSPAASSALTIGHKDVSSDGHPDGVDIDPSRPDGTIDEEIRGVKIRTDEHFACVTNKDVIFDVREAWNQRIHGAHHDPTGDGDGVNAWNTVIDNGDAKIVVEHGSLNIDVRGSADTYEHIDLLGGGTGNLNLHVKNDYTEVVDGDLSSSVGGHEDRLNMGADAKATLGATNELYVGEKGELHIGLKFEAFIGGQIELNLALQGEVTVAGKLEVNAGGVYTWEFGPHLDNNPTVDMKKVSALINDAAVALDNCKSAHIKKAAMALTQASIHMYV
ncbi:MAG: type VI secretion system tip protein VgrG, partial [Phycisphaerales bacterium]|nr:type VI secretion system tip protein VgrG [Phycisphaerales bacterium]